MVEIAIVGGFQLEGIEANVVERLVVNAESFVGVFY